MLHLILNIGYSIVLGLIWWLFLKIETPGGFFLIMLVIFFLNAFYLAILSKMIGYSFKKYNELKKRMELVNICISSIIIFVNACAFFIILQEIKG